jgi:DNA-binding FadR family transcriptional regulator
MSIIPTRLKSTVRPGRSPAKGRRLARLDGKGTTGQVTRVSAVANGASPDRVVTVVDRLTEAIVMGDFDENRVLPSEGDLASSFGVSRTVVREAMRSLRAQGLVEASKGRVARVKPPDSQATVASLRLLLRRNKASLLHLLEVRQHLEGDIAAMAALRANEVHLRQLEKAVNELDATSPLAARVEADMQFHRILGEATGNPVFVLLIETLAEFTQELYHRTLDPSGVEYARAGHRAILKAVRNRDAVKAHKAMRDHLQTAARYLQAKSGRREAWAYLERVSKPGRSA